MPKFDPRFWEISVDPELLAEQSEEPSEHGESGPKAALKRAAVEQLRIVIRERLTPRQREILEMYFFEGLTQQEVADRVGLSQQVVSKHLFGVIRKGKKVGGALTKLRKSAAELGIDPSKWV